MVLHTSCWGSRYVRPMKNHSYYYISNQIRYVGMLRMKIFFLGDIIAFSGNVLGNWYKLRHHISAIEYSRSLLDFYKFSLYGLTHDFFSACSSHLDRLSDSASPYVCLNSTSSSQHEMCSITFVEGRSCLKVLAPSGNPHSVPGMNEMGLCSGSCWRYPFWMFSLLEIYVQLFHYTCTNQ